MKRAGLALAALILVAWMYAGSPIPASVVGLDLPFLGRGGVVTKDTTFYPGSDIQTVVAALVMNQMVGDVGGLCDQGVTCEGRQIIRTGRHVRVIQEVTLQNDRINAKFVQVQAGDAKGWIRANAVE